MHSILQIVPTLPPETGGVADYALALARALADSHHVASSFLVGKPSWQASSYSDGFPATQVSARTAQELALRIEDTRPSAVLLHLSGYGYDPNGCPAWLADGLSLWKEKSGGRLVTMVHETYAFGPPWKKAFWLSPRQRSIVSRIASLSDVVFTNTHRYRLQLEHFDPRKKGQVPVLPVFSNVGEILTAPPLAQRPRRMIVFGGALTRERAYGAGRKELLAACDALGLKEIVDVGPALPRLPRLEGRTINAIGICPPEAVSALMRDSVAGYVNYFPGYEAKSSVFAAYCAHAMLPVTSDAHGSERDGLLPGVQYWCGSGRDLSLAGAQLIADASFSWYGSHNLATHAKSFAAILRASSGTESKDSVLLDHAKEREVIA